MRKNVLCGWSLLLLTFFAGLLSILWIRHIAAPHLLGIDDASMFFRYARNLFDGEGFVWTPGGEAVEGFSSILWLVCAWIATALSSSPEEMLLAVNLVLLSITWACLVRAVVIDVFGDEDRLLHTKVAAAWGIWLLLNPSFVLWSFTPLMETGLWSVALAWSSYCFARYALLGEGRLRVGVLIVLLLITRPEGIVFCAVGIFAGMAWRVFFRPGRAGRFADFRGPLITAVVSTAILHAWRYYEFGTYFPNTYYAKEGSDLGYQLREGFEYLCSFTGDVPAVPMAFLAACCAFLQARSWLHEVKITDEGGAIACQLFLCASFMAAGGALYVMIGGDHFWGFRFYQPFIPMAFLLLLYSAGLLRAFPLSGVPHGVCRAFMILTAVAAVGSAPAIYRELEDRYNLMYWEFRLTELGREAARAMNRALGNQAKPSIGVISAGALGLAYEGQTIDLLGLNDTRIARSSSLRYGLRGHASFDTRSFLKLRPELFIWDGAPCTMQRPYSKAESPMGRIVSKNIVEDSEFRALYLPVVVRLFDDDEKEFLLCGHALRSALQKYVFISRRPRPDELEGTFDRRSSGALRHDEG